MVKANASKIELKDQISELNYVHINLINFNEQPISLGPIPGNLKIRAQPLGSDANGFFHQDGRIDNCHRTLHQHSGGLVYPIQGNSLTTLNHNTSLFIKII